VWAGGAVGAAAADPQWQPTTAAGGKNLAALVRRLGAARYAERVKAQEELLKLDAGAVPAILDVLAREKLNAEAVERARQVVVQLRIPQFGAVWRDVAGGMRPEGVQAGDVVLACGDVPIRCKADLEAYTAGQPSPRVRVWRKGQELFLTRMAAINECLFGFRDWPDEQARYETSGHRGEWDQAVETALADYRSGDPRSAEELAKAWEQGCRDGVVLLAWARRLEQSGELAGAQQVLRARMGQAVDRSFGADLLHFDLPLEDARIAWLDGNEPEAMRLLDAAIGKAAAGGLSRQAARLHSQKVLWMFWRDPPGAMAY